jgi:hypothetical protein
LLRLEDLPAFQWGDQSGEEARLCWQCQPALPCYQKVVCVTALQHRASKLSASKAMLLRKIEKQKIMRTQDIISVADAVLTCNRLRELPEKLAQWTTLLLAALTVVGLDDVHPILA